MNHESTSVLTLKKNPSFKLKNRKVVLVIMDGFGIGKDNIGNAFLQAATPTLDKLIKTSLFVWKAKDFEKTIWASWGKTQPKNTHLKPNATISHLPN